VNKVVFKENIPSIEDIILKPEQNQVWVYFPVEGEAYYLVVVLALEPYLTVNWAGNLLNKPIILSPENASWAALFRFDPLTRSEEWLSG
jgi:hypothetical protein